MCFRINIKTFGVCLAMILFFLLPGAALAESPPADLLVEKEIAKVQTVKTPPAKAGEQTASVSLEQAIGIAKEAFTVPEGFSQFSTGFDQSGDKSFWNLRWYRSGEPGGEMNVRVNSQTGDIWSMGQWVPSAPGQEYRGLPKYTREQAQSAAATLAKKLQPERFKLTRLQPDQNYYQPLTFLKRGQVEYQYNYARIVEGVPYEENGISISVSGDTGQVIRFDLRWDDIKGFPPAAGRIGLAQAEQIFRTDAGPELSYFRSRTPGGKETPLKLVYRLPGQQNRAVIDALSGKVLSREDELYAYDLAGGGGMEKMANSRAAVPLSPAEESAVEEAKSLLSKEKALDLARSAVKVPGEYVLNNSSLEQDYLYKDKKTWHFNWEAGSGTERKAMDIAVDAATGELVSFNTNSYRTMYDYYLKVPEVKFSEEAALKIAGDYLRKVQSAKWSEVILENTRPEFGPLIDPGGEPQPRAYSFNWVRLAKDIPFPDNGFNLVVDSATGEITSYRMTWWDVKFPDPQGVVSREDAAGKFLKEAPLTAAYMRLWTGDMYSKIIREEGQVHLVYYTTSHNFAMLDAFTGQLLDYDGKVVLPTAKYQKFEDLDGHPAREAVELLAQTSIVAAGNGKFRPDDAVTQAELITMLVKSSGQYPVLEFRTAAAGKDPWYLQYYETAVRLGIIQAGENPDPDLPVTREVLARLTIHAMGFYQVARLSDIYKLDFQDAGYITDNLRGHAALAVGLGLIEPLDGKFEPKAVVTRGEAAETLVKLLKSN